MKVGDDGDLEPETGRPLRRQDIVPRDTKPQRGLAKSISDGGNTGCAEAGDET